LTAVHDKMSDLWTKGALDIIHIYLERLLILYPMRFLYTIWDLRV